MSAKVAVITRTKDRPIMLRRAMQSVLAQTFTDWVMVVVNDAGSHSPVDGLAATFASEFKGRLLVLHNEVSRGMEAATNVGIRGSDSEYIVVLDDDDTWAPTFLERTVSFLSLPESSVFGGVSTGFNKVVEHIEGDQIVEESRADESWLTKEISLWNMCARNLYPVNSFLYRRSCLEAVGPWSDELPVLADWDFHLRFLTHYDVAYLPQEVLANYHHRPSAAGEYGNSFGGALDKHAVVRNHLRNEWLRKDLAEGKIGLGVLVNLAHDLHGLRAREDEVFSMLAAGSMGAKLRGLKKKLSGRRTEP